MVGYPGVWGGGSGADPSGAPWYGSGCPIWLYFPLFGLFGHCLAVFPTIWPYLATVWPCFAVFGLFVHCLALFCCIWPLLGPVLLCLAVLGPVVGPAESSVVGPAESLVMQGPGLVPGGLRGQWNRVPSVCGFVHWPKWRFIQK